MTGRDPNPQRSCHLKTRYRDKQSARAMARKVSRGREGVDAVKVYSCKLCRGYHIGHLVPSAQRNETPLSLPPDSGEGS